MTRHVLCAALLAGVVPSFGQIVISPGENVQAAIDGAAPGSTLLLKADTYTMPAPLSITKKITIGSDTPGSRAVLQFPGGTIVAVSIQHDDVRLESLRITGGMWGVFASNGSNITIRNVAVNAVAGANSGHALFFINAPNAVADSNVIEASPVDGIVMDTGSHNATVINNTVNAASQGIRITKSDGAVVAGNTLNNVNQFGILLQGSKYARIDRNTITTGVKQDGIVLTHTDGMMSQSNYVGRNVVTSNQFQANNPAGTGIWLNSESNGTLVYGNTTSGVPENGFTIFNSSNSWFWGNVTSGNGHGGIFIYGPTDPGTVAYSPGPPPANNFVQGNYAFNLPFNAGVNLNQSSTTTVFNNMVKNSPAGIWMQQTSGDRVFLNLLHNDTQGMHAFAGASGETYFLNRHLNAMPNYADPGSSITFDGGTVFGGNYQAGGKVLTDAYPYSTETLGRTPSLNVVLPVAGTVAGVATRKTIEWHSTGCTYVDISYSSGGTGKQSIVSNYPDVGVYQWIVPATAARMDYTIVIDCKNSAGAALGASGSSAAFTIAAAGVELLSPQGNHRVTAGSPTRVTWSRGQGATGAVTVQYRSSIGGALTTLGSNIAGNETLVTVPADGTTQGMFVITVAGSSASDSSDGFVNVADTTPEVIGPSGALGIGTLQLIRWNSHPSSSYVDIEYWDGTASTYRTLVTNLPDFGRFYFLVPDKTLTSTHLRVRFKNAALGAITTANSGTFNTVASGGGTTAATPNAMSVSPTSGTGSTQVFTVTHSDANGAADIAATYFMVNTTIDGAHSCFVEYNRSSNAFRLMNDAGSTWSPSLPAGSGSASNSSCTLTGSGSGATAAGNNLTVTYNLTFSGAANTRNTYGLAIDAANGNSGWKPLGTWTVSSAPPANSAPTVVSLTPTTGSGLSGTFTAIFRHPGGATKHYLGYMLFLPLPNVASFNAQGTCLIEYNRVSNGMRLIDNAGTGWLGPLEGVPVTPAAAPLSNSACTVNIAATVPTLSGTDMIISVPVTFNPAGVTGVMGSFIQEQDVNGQWTDFRQFGNWTVPGAGTRPGAFVTGATPASGSGSSLTLTTTTGHTSGAGNVGQVHIRLNTAIVGGNPCHAVYFPGSNTVALVNDTDTGIVGPVPLGTALNTNRCTLAAGGSRSISGNNVTVTLPFTFNTGLFGGAKNVYTAAYDVFGGVTHWVQTGTWTVQ